MIILEKKPYKLNFSNLILTKARSLYTHACCSLPCKSMWNSFS